MAFSGSFLGIEAAAGWTRHQQEVVLALPMQILVYHYRALPKIRADMSSTDSLDDHALASTTPPAAAERDHLLHRSLATYRYENALVKTELAATLERHSREVEELRLKYETQLREVERQRQDVERRLSQLQDAEVEKETRLHQANLHLQQKIKALEEDLTTSTKGQEKLQQEKTQVEEELQESRFSWQASKQDLQADNEKLCREVEELRRELEKERSSLREVTATLTSERHQHQLIKSRVTEVEQHCQVQLTLAEAQAAQLRQEKAQEEAAATKRISEVMSLLEEEKALVVRVREGATGRQKELEKHLAEERQAHVVSTQQLTRHNNELQQDVKALEDKVRSLEEKEDVRVRELRGELQAVTEKMHTAEREAAVAGARVTGLEDMERLLRQERDSASSLRQELHRCQGELQDLRGTNTDLRHSLQQLTDTLHEAQAQQESTKEEAQREQVNRMRMLSDLRSSHQEEVERLRARITTLETHLTDKSTKYLEDAGVLRQKVHTYGKLIKKLRHKLEMSALQVEQLEAQRAALQDNVPADKHAQLQMKLQVLTRKHNEFAAFIRGLGQFQSSLPEISELTTRVGALNQKLDDMEEDQRQCLSDLESL